MKPTTETLTAVTSWLTSNSISVSSTTSSSPAGDILQITLPVSHANALLHANFTSFTRSEDGEQTIRTLSYSIPKELEAHVDFVHPTVM